MSRSIKKAIIKDVGFGTKLYRRVTKRSIKNKLKDQLLLEDPDAIELPSEKNIINDYTRCDWVYDFENKPNKRGKITEEDIKKARRK